MANHTVNNLISYNYPPMSAEPAYRIKLAPYLDYLRKHKDTKTIPVQQATARPYYYNLYGYLRSQGYDNILHWIIMKMSDLPSPEAFDEKVETLVVPNISLIDEIRIIITS